MTTKAVQLIPLQNSSHKSGSEVSWEARRIYLKITKILLIWLNFEPWSWAAHFILSGWQQVCCGVWKKLNIVSPSSFPGHCCRIQGTPKSEVLPCTPIQAPISQPQLTTPTSDTYDIMAITQRGVQYWELQEIISNRHLELLIHRNQGPTFLAHLESLKQGYVTPMHWDSYLYRAYLGQI